jgi:hypothetical protein
MLDHRAGPLMCLVFAVISSGCAAAAHHSSPWEFGGGLRLAPELMVVQEGMTAHPMGSVTYLSFDGGYDLLWELGGQIRSQLASPLLGGRLSWIGAEAAGSHLVTHIEGLEETSDANGFSLTALIGTPFSGGAWRTSLYAGAGISRYGSTGINLRAGVDLQRGSP